MRAILFSQFLVTDFHNLKSNFKIILRVYGFGERPNHYKKDWKKFGIINPFSPNVQKNAIDFFNITVASKLI